MLERTTAGYMIIYLVNQLFIAHNDILEFGWLEREFYSTESVFFVLVFSNGFEYDGGCSSSEH
jgi:hypothetical protein